MATKTDIKIIKELKNNGRATYSELSASLGITPSTVARRIEKLIKSNAMDVRAMPNPFKLGLKASAFVAIKVALEKHDEICRTLLARNFRVSTILSVLGDFDILCLIHYQTWDELNTFICEELGTLDGVLDYDCYYVNETVKRYHHIFGDQKQYNDNVDLKPIDWKLIEHLSINGRTSTSELSKRTGQHISTISRRIISLLDQNIIKITSQPNPGKFGLNSSAVVIIRVNPKEMDALCHKIYPVRNVFLLLKTINRPNLIIGVVAKSNEEIFDIINEKILIGPRIHKSHIFVRSKIIKSSYSWYLQEPNSE